MGGCNKFTPEVGFQDREAAGMPVFEYQVRDISGLVRRDLIQSASQPDAVAALHAQQLQILHLRESRPRASLRWRLFGRFKRVDEKSMLLFTRQFATMLRAGLPLLRCLATLSKQATSSRLRQVTNLVRAELEAGTSLSKAMADYPDAFDHLYVSMIAVGEAGGLLPETVDRLAGFLEKDFVLRRRVKQALAYPAFVFVVVVAVVWALVSFIIPRFVDMFTQAGMDVGKVPAITRALIWIAQVFGQPWVTGAGLIVVVAAFLIYDRVGRTKRGRRLFDRLKLNAPVFGRLAHMVAMARMCRTFGTLVAAGIPILQSLEIVGASSGNSMVESAMQMVKASVNAGEDLKTPMSRSVLFAPMVVQMVEVGEQTGNLDSMLYRVADYYDAEVEYILGALASLIEPIMILGLGGVVLFIVLAVMLPILTLVQSQMT